MQEAISKALDLLRQLAETMGQTTAYLWPKMILYTWVEALMYAILLPLIFLIAFTILCRTVKEGTARKWPDEPGLYLRLVPAALISFFVGLAILLDWPSKMATLISPEGHVVLKILGK